MRKPHFKNRAARGAFTLIEILVVLVIMGFLVSLVAPKLSGVVDSAVDTNCDTNQERLRKVLNTQFMVNNSLPSGLVNLAIVDSSGAYNVPKINDADKTNGAEVLSDEFTDRFNPEIHTLTADEADQLKGLGVSAVNNFAVVSEDTAAYTAADYENLTITEKNQNIDIAAGVGVLMAGGENGSGSVPASTIVNGTETDYTGTDDYTAVANARLDEAKFMGRILFGIDNQSELVTSGMMDAAGICPGQLSNADMFEYGNYVLVTPRLEATAETLTTALSPTSATAPTFEAWEEKEDGSYLKIGSGELDTGAQELSALTTSCPEGHTWGAAADVYTVIQGT